MSIRKKDYLKDFQGINGLEFQSLLITINNIYSSRQKIKNGEPDWYGVLHLINKPATLEEICANYYKLHAKVEEGRNNVAGAEGALKILLEALCMLTQTFWTKCPGCKFRFHYSNARTNKELVCINCGNLFVAVPITCDNYPTHFTMCQDVVLALSASSSNPKGEASDDQSEINMMLIDKARTEILK
ncbi:unnamed protein product [Lactuca virosa]|uniref:Uncharacterized protein n=1 Tax=Lactuca virosa TaxID=75947 RepID=A0AAU9MRD7_9ASTR|nr:unnamed protein product [Lactuca virosa]